MAIFFMKLGYMPRPGVQYLAPSRLIHAQPQSFSDCMVMHLSYVDHRRGCYIASFNVKKRFYSLCLLVHAVNT